MRKLVEYVLGESILYREYVTDIHTVLEKNPVQWSPRDREGLPKVGYKHLRAASKRSLPVLVTPLRPRLYSFFLLIQDARMVEGIRVTAFAQLLIPSFKNCNESVLYCTVVGFHFRRSEKSAFLSHLPR